MNKRGVDEELLRLARDTMSHRGPDDAGLWMSPDKTIGLAHRRLSILDLSEAGRQPMSDDEGKIWITYNGEVYNFQQIREELTKKGFRFTSQTDTEVIIYAYKQWGTDCLRRFNGMFAFGLYDSDKKILFLVRDRAGKKPLYYTQYGSRFAFASELKALTQNNMLSREIDLHALNLYLTFGYISGELCIFKEIRKLPPAHAMIYDLNTGRRKIWSYWEPLSKTENTLAAHEMLEELEALLEDAVRLRMISDVPLGAFLSGGVDSSLVVAMMSRISDSPVKTFSIGFEESKYNELSYARVVADHFNTDHHEIIIKPDAFSILPELVRQFDEPFADSSMIPTYYVSKATREYVTVALSGDGGDELFGGYSQYLGSLGNYYTTMLIPSLIRKGVAKVAGYLPEKFIAKRQLLRLKFDPYSAFIDRCSHLYFKERYRSDLLNWDEMTALKDEFAEPERARLGYLLQGERDFINRLTYADFKTYLPDDVLTKVDRTSMLVSLEVRAPLLDYRIVNFSFSNIPGSFKVKRARTKYLLKKLAREILPKELDINRKWGFAIPISGWFRGPLYKETREFLLEHTSCFFDRRYIEKLLAEHRKGIEHSGRLYTLLVFTMWAKEYRI
ncbi:MAG: asparagine synthase (glutamine-hydrolyzing) [Deltaproteobacteria bacterium]|nr:asparagine synthase (glutamine-hydrolyzing) [Deltaproteobacteria bacterium]